MKEERGGIRTTPMGPNCVKNRDRQKLMGGGVGGKFWGWENRVGFWESCDKGAR